MGNKFSLSLNRCVRMELNFGIKQVVNRWNSLNIFMAIGESMNYQYLLRWGYNVLMIGL